ncbi:MAG: hypothetical protein KME15_06485 [Drouetiella hepatica Uher 2000/2452]|jgi:ribosomal protein L6P/L9E|uniref:Uncharacterized protein n=1 Tax=Drouetiella hepatica Uher 2000/2452 TaxID=904376 RepID=A0A951Q7Q8_9CYAN|nr:hypothetical protein [Drouetiella hepatica Uher 2000/2452]
MTNSLKDRLITDFEKAKATGKPRVIRVLEAFRNAASQAIVEVKEGSGEVSNIAKDTLSAISEDLNSAHGKAADAPEADSSIRLKALLANVVKVVKQGFSKAVGWYNTSKAQAETTDAASPEVWEHEKAKVETKVGEAGTALAKKEQQVRQQLKEMLHTAAAKL